MKVFFAGENVRDKLVAALPVRFAETRENIADGRNATVLDSPAPDAYDGLDHVDWPAVDQPQPLGLGHRKGRLPA
jgi:hypothetical protein